MNHSFMQSARLIVPMATLGCCLVILFCTNIAPAETPGDEFRPIEFVSPSSVPEARARARLLHETIHGTLQVVHRDLFDEDDAFAIPSSSLEDVFEELADQYDVKLRWLVVNTDMLNVDHRPKGEFEASAALSLAAGRPFVERITPHRYDFVGSIALKSQCLKCHVKRRTDDTERVAGLRISMPRSPLKP